MAASPSTGSNQSMAERAYLQLRDKLILLDIAPGEPIIEADLADELGIGRTPIREALKRLEMDYLTASFPRRGTFATQIDIAELVKISDVRTQLEPLAARRAAELGGGAEGEVIEELLVELNSMSIDLTHRELFQLDLRVHRAIYEAAENRYLSMSLIRLNNLATRTWAHLIHRLPSIAHHIHNHSELLRNILDGEADAASAHAVTHVIDFEKTIRSTLLETGV